MDDVKSVLKSAAIFFPEIGLNLIPTKYVARVVNIFFEDGFYLARIDDADISYHFLSNLEFLIIFRI